MLPLFGIGLWWLFKNPRFRLLAWTAVVVEVGLFAVGGKSYYAGPIYALLFAAGAIPVEGWLKPRWSRIAAPAVAAVVTAALLPIGLPILSTQAMADSGLWKLRKDFADMYGWTELVDTVSQTYDSIPSSQRATTMILTDNYGEAGAINLYGPARGLPTAVSGQLSYWYWLPPGADPQTVLVVGLDASYMAPYFADCRQVSTLTNRYGVRNEEWGRPVLICDQPRRALSQVWGDFRAFR